MLRSKTTKYVSNSARAYKKVLAAQFVYKNKCVCEPQQKCAVYDKKRRGFNYTACLDWKCVDGKCQS